MNIKKQILKFFFVMTATVIAVFAVHSLDAQAQSHPPGAIPADSRTEHFTMTSSFDFSYAAKAYKKKTKRIPVFYWKSQGIKAKKGCNYDPVKKGNIKVGQPFINTWKGGVIGWRPWRKGDVLCGARKGRDKRGAFVTGTIKRCGNKRVKIYLKRVRGVKFKKVTEFKSTKAFMRIHGSETITETRTIYVCPAGYTLNGTMCYPPPAKDGTQTPPPPEEAPGPNPQPSPQDPAPGGHKCYDESTGQPVEPRPDGTCPPGSYGGG